MTSTLSRWLASRTPDDLAEILGRRPEALGARDIGDAAARMQSPYALAAVIHDLPQPCLEVLETLLVYGNGGIDRDRLAAVFAVPANDRTFDAALRVCEMWALAWSVDDRWHVSGALRAVLPHPLGLGPSVAELLSVRTVDDLRSRGTALGIAVPPRKTEIVDRLAEFYADADQIRRLSAGAPSAQRELLVEAAWHGPALGYDGMYLYTGRPDPAISYLLRHGLAIADWQQIVVPREVALAIRGADWHPMLTPRPEFRVLEPAPPEAVDRAAAGAAAVAVDAVIATVDACGAAPLAMRKTGGVGVREIRRLAKTMGQDEPTTRLWLAIAHAAGLLAFDHDDPVPAASPAGRLRGETGVPAMPALMPTAAYDDWLAAAPGPRLAALLRGWRSMRADPPLRRADGGRPLLAEAAWSGPGLAADLRGDVLNVAAEIPEGRGAGDLAEVAARARWERPTTGADTGDPDGAVAAAWAEACAVGAIGLGALSSLGRALRSPAGGDPDRDPDLDAVTAGFLPDNTAQAIFQADLTVVVPGSCGPDLAALLDSVADRESRGAATTWRCSAASVRRALDGGASADDLTGRLRAAAVGALPQPLEYLIGDVARRHGQLRVREVGCVLRADDTALLAEIAAAKPLARLGLTVLAPTVLATAKDVGATLEALRAAGYTPVGESTDGVALVERASRRRARPAPAPAGPAAAHRRSGPAADPRKLAAALLATAPLSRPVSVAGTGTKSPEARSPAARPTAVAAPRVESLALARYARHLSRGETFLLGAAIDEQSDVRIRYTSGEGDRTTRVILPIEIDDGILVAWCYLRDAERNFVLGRIESVEPV
jgi:hypothetical protein